jgi:hypothetical protein
MTPIQNIESILGPVASAEMHELIEADAEKPLQRQGALHSQLLGQFFAGFYVTPADKHLRKVALFQIARLHALIDRGVPIVENRIECDTLDPQEIVRERLGGFINFNWPEELAPHMEVTLREYHRHGYLDLADMDIPNSAGTGPASYLELAITGSNPYAVTALLEMGALRERVPAHDHENSWNAGDFDAFIDALHGRLQHPVRAAIDEGVRRRLAIDMTAAIEDRREIEPLARPGAHVQRRARL